MSLQERVTETVTVAVRLEWRDRITTIQPMVIHRGDAVDEIRLDGCVIGFIHRAGHIFVALTGARLDHAEECGQSVVWDKAFALLLPESYRSSGADQAASSGAIAEPDRHYAMHPEKHPAFLDT